MDKIARELVKVAKELTAAGDINLDAYFDDMFKNIMKKMHSEISKIKGVESIRKEWRDSPKLVFALTAEGYARGDIEASCTVVVEYSENWKQVQVWAKRPDWGNLSTDMLKENIHMSIPLDKIIGKFDIVFNNH